MKSRLRKGERARARTNTASVKAALVGRQIKRVELNYWPDGRGNLVTSPILVLDDGTVISFVVKETETDYAVKLVISERLAGDRN